MEKIYKSEFLKVISRLMLGVTFLFFAIAKISDPSQFAKEIGNYQLFPMFSLNIIAITLPWIELSLGVMLIIGAKVKASSFLTGILMITFIVSIAFAMSKGLNISCGCSGANSPKIGLMKILENLALLSLCIYLFFQPYSKFSIENNTTANI